MTKPQPRQRVTHKQSQGNAEKGVCRKRGAQSRRTEEVTCPDCLTMLHRANDSAKMAMLRMVGSR